MGVSPGLWSTRSPGRGRTGSGAPRSPTGGTTTSPEATNSLPPILALPDGRHPAQALSPQQQKQQTQDALIAWTLEEAERQPLLTLWEDLHWADPSTLELIGLLIEQAPTAPLLMVLTSRPEFVPPWPARSHMTPITIKPAGAPAHPRPW